MLNPLHVRCDPRSQSCLLQKVEEMSAYERERAEHIARNRERMAALQLPSLANSIAPKKEARPAKQRGISSKRHKEPVSLHTKHGLIVYAGVI